MSIPVADLTFLIGVATVLTGCWIAGLGPGLVGSGVAMIGASFWVRGLTRRRQAGRKVRR